MMSQCFRNIPLKLGHLSIQDTSPSPQGVHNRVVPLYPMTQQCINPFGTSTSVLARDNRKERCFLRDQSIAVV